MRTATPRQIVNAMTKNATPIQPSSSLSNDFGQASDDYEEVSDHYEEVSDHYEEASDDYEEVSDHYEEVSDDFGESEEKPEAPRSRFAAFENRNFRRYFIGQTISSVGSWTQSLAVTWLVLELTNRSDQLGIAMALQFLPMLVFGAPAGVLADKFNNRRLLVGTSIVSGLLALSFAVVASTGHATIWWIYALSLLFGLVLAVERPAMQAIVFQLVGPICCRMPLRRTAPSPRCHVF
jgi:Transmembrane secretion effector